MTRADREMLAFGVAAWLLLRNRAPRPQGPTGVRRRVWRRRDVGDRILNAAFSAEEHWVSPTFRPAPVKYFTWYADDGKGGVGDSINEGKAPYRTWAEFWQTEAPPGSETFTPGAP